MMMSVNNYEIIGKAIVERGGSAFQYTLKLLYRGDGTPWWTCSSGLEWPCSKEFFDSVGVGERLNITIQSETR
jgi:hypothetical protein